MQSVQVTSPSVQKANVVDTVSDCLTRARIQEEGEDIVVETIDELMSMVMDRCLQVYTKRQVKLRDTFLISSSSLITEVNII